jgi:rubrerythrin
MKKMTTQALDTAFAGESMAHMKYLVFSAIAEKEGKPNIARMFKAISYAEQVHATNHARNLGYIGDTAANLVAAKGGEDFEITEMYPVYNATAKLQDEKGAELSTHYALEAEKIHSKMYGRAQECVKAGKDIEIGTVYICPICGHTCEDEAPGVCPICQCKGEKFIGFA